MNVVVNGILASYQKTGKGKPLVLLHGWGDSSKTFAGLAAELKRNYEIYAVDLPGFGASQAPAEAWDLQKYADFLKTWIKKINIEPAAIIGHSFGGSVAVVAVSDGLPVHNLILLASSGIRDKNSLQKKFMSAGAKAGKIPLKLLPAGKQKAVKQKIYGSIGSEIVLVPHMEETFRKIIGQDIRGNAAKITAPTLIIYGSHDKSTPISDGHILNRSIRGSMFEIIDAGHFLHQEHSQKIAQLIRQFLEDKK
jgi:pimeloyl-ACP methyl ester carboxylesterase